MRVHVIKESATGRNERFKDSSGKEMTRAQFVKEIKSDNSQYTDYYVRKINGIAIPVSKPDGITSNNLG